MHLGDGALTPECVVLTTGAAATGLALSAAAIRRSGCQRSKLELAASLGCLTLAAQALNVPVGMGISGHLIGGVLLAAVLGPALGAVTMAAVLAVQAIALGDGGALSLGANVLNMAIVPAALVTAVNRVLAGRGDGWRRAFGVGSLAAISLVMAAGLITLETAAFRTESELTTWPTFASLMLITHAWIGVWEGCATVVLFRVFSSATVARNLRPRWHAAAAAGMALVAVVAVLSSPLSSGLADGYEAAAARSEMGWLLKP
jgi:cobalt/nickel transport system permease protein